MKYSIDKSELMKMAWKIARREYRRRALVQILRHIESAKTVRDYMLDGGDELISQYPQYIKYSVRDCMNTGLRDAWATAKENISQELENERVERKINIVKDAERCNAEAPRRELVPAGKYSVGQKLYGFVITGLGRSFHPHVDMFSMGITPDTERVQYAYFN